MPKNMVNFEAFCKVNSSSIKLFLLKSEPLYLMWKLGHLVTAAGGRKIDRNIHTGSWNSLASRQNIILRRVVTLQKYDVCAQHKLFRETLQKFAIFYCIRKPMYLVFFSVWILCHFEFWIMNALVYVECQHRPRTKSMGILYLRPSIMYLTSVTKFLEENIFIGSLIDCITLSSTMYILH